MKAKKLALALIILLLLAGCAQKTGQSYQNIGPEDLHSLLLQKNISVVLVDVREPGELEETGFIPGAVNIPLGQIEKRLGEISRDRKVVIYCRSGRRSAEAGKLLTEKGYTDVYNLEGGITAWPYDKTR
ncbi:MAG: hypothetical protein JL50_06490 [Peptococcaceae bacterium BICA1-7]|nr:MAG: hypothetical protein JL50_06490 [Peptococcaceae bacterium BICA1-7]HBV99284.1 rhodanese-like domain-containing protein [Desulfotomaculum sp.]